MGFFKPKAKDTSSYAAGGAPAPFVPTAYASAPPAPPYNPNAASAPYNPSATRAPPYNPNASSAPSAPGGGPPKKYTKVNGVMKLNPAYKAWKDAQGGPGSKPATTVITSSQALPIVSSMDDYASLNDAATVNGGAEIALAESTNATIEMMQEPEICLEAGMTVDAMVDELGAILNKYEVPMGLMNKLMMLTEFESLEFMLDDSGSMTLQSDTKGPDGLFQTRWQEAQERLKEMVEVLAFVPFTQIDILFLNRSDRLTLTRNNREPRVFLADAYRQIDHVFIRGPSGTTPALEKIQDSLIRGAGRNIARYFFGDGVPNGGLHAQAEITKIITYRENPQGNPVTFISVTNEDAAVEWMKDAEEAAPYCSESDDFEDEAREVLRDQGAALPFSRGFHLVCQLVAAMNPDDLDAMDESVPFTKTTLDNLLGVQHNEQSYRHYFTCFTQAQKMRVVEIGANGRPKQSDQLKKSTVWNYEDFMAAPVASQIPQVQALKEQLKRVE
jgi:hypothetical protein